MVRKSIDIKTAIKEFKKIYNFNVDLKGIKTRENIFIVYLKVF